LFSSTHVSLVGSDTFKQEHYCDFRKHGDVEKNMGARRNSQKLFAWS